MCSAMSVTPARRGTAHLLTSPPTHCTLILFGACFLAPTSWCWAQMCRCAQTAEAQPSYWQRVQPHGVALQELDATGPEGANPAHMH